jgi:hypothetical protein
MGKSRFLLSGLIPESSVYCKAENKKPSVKSNESIVTQAQQLNPFKKIKLISDAEIHFHVCKDYRAVITVDSKFADYIRLIIKRRTLIIGVKKGRLACPNFSVDVYAPCLTAVSIHAFGTFETADEIIVPSFKVKIDGVGSLECIINCNKLSAEISGAGEIKFIGSGYRTNVNIDGTGAFYGDQYDTNWAALKIAGDGVVNIGVSERLEGNIAGFGIVNYSGDPKTNFRGSGFRVIRKYRSKSALKAAQENDMIFYTPLFFQDHRIPRKVKTGAKPGQEFNSSANLSVADKTVIHVFKPDDLIQ